MSKLLSSTGFRLTKWNSSKREIVSEIPEKNLAPALSGIVEKGFDNHPGKSQTTLGLVLDTEMNKFFLKKLGQKIEILKNQGLTKRQVVSINNGLFDPLSWWAPLYVQINITCSKIVRQMKDWDDKVTNDLNKEWLKAIDCLRLLNHMAIPRCKVPDKDKDEHAP